MMTAVLGGLVNKYHLAGVRLGDVSLGAVIKHSRDWNLARESVLGTALAPETPAFDIQRACGTSLEAAILIGNKIALGQIDAGIAGGTDSISDSPIVYPDNYRSILLDSFRARSAVDRIKPWLRLRPSHFKPELPGVVEPRTGLSMGQSTEITAKTVADIPARSRTSWRWKVITKPRLRIRKVFTRICLLPFNGVSADNNVRPDTSMEQLARLKPAFDKSVNGTMTAGNSTPLTDGAAAVLLASEEWAKQHDLPVLAYLRYGKVAAVDFIKTEGLLMAPAYAVADMLNDAGLGLGDFDLYEIHEAFAAQILATMKAWESEEFCRTRLDRDKPTGQH